MNTTQLNIPTKQRGDLVTAREFNTMVEGINTLLASSSAIVRLTQGEYDALPFKQSCFYAVVAADGQLESVYFSTTLVMVRSSFPYTFPFNF